MAATTSPLSAPGTKLGSGQAGDVHAWDRGKVVKLYRPSVPGQRIEAEAANSQALHSAGLPVPRFFEHVEIAGRRGSVFERIDGRSMSTLLRVNPFRLPRIAQQFADIHRLIHRTEQSNLPPVAGNLRRVISDVAVLTAAQRNKLIALLNSLPSGSSVCHFDFQPGNVILSPQGPVVIDWGSARLGNPLADVARTYVLLATDHLWSPIAPLAKIRNKAFVRSYLRCYFDGAPQRPEELERWIPILAAARLRKGQGRATALLIRLVEPGLRNQLP